MEQLGSKLAADLHGQLFEAGEGGAPRRTFGAVEVADQVFGGSGQDRTPFRRYFYLRNLFSHLQLLASVACLMESGLPWFNLRTAEMPCKPCRTPSSGGFLSLTSPVTLGPTTISPPSFCLHPGVSPRDAGDFHAQTHLQSKDTSERRG